MGTAGMMGTPDNRAYSSAQQRQCMEGFGKFQSVLGGINETNSSGIV